MGVLRCITTFTTLVACVLPQDARAQGPPSGNDPDFVESKSSPNVLFIIADDLGIGDLGCYGNKVVDTPVIDSLAAGGIRFTQHYAPSPLCAPSRAGFLTGRFNHRTGAVDVPSNRGLDRIALSEKTFGNYFQDTGYTTALIGKWHNGLYCRDYLPDRRGFDLFFGFPNGGQDYYQWNLLRNKAQQPSQHVPSDGRYMTDVLNDEACAFILSSAKQNKPFALFLAHHVPHVPFQAPERQIEKYRQKLQTANSGDPAAQENVAIIYAMIEAMDSGLGKVFQTLKQRKLWNNTVIVFTSDNGAWLGRYKGQTTQRFHAGLSGNKGDVGEQGIRVPAIIAWPGHIDAAQVIDTPIHGCDWLPTLLSVTDAQRRPDQAQRRSDKAEGKIAKAMPEHRHYVARSGLRISEPDNAGTIELNRREHRAPRNTFPCDECDSSFPLIASVKIDSAFDGINLMPLLMGRPMPELDVRQLPFQKNRYRPAAHSDAAIREGRWKLMWPGVAVTMKKDSARDNPSYLKGLTEPHWEMRLDTQLDPVPKFTDPKPRLFDLLKDPAEQNDVAADHPELVNRLSTCYDAWFRDVMKDWRKSRRAIVEHDQAWWQGKVDER